MEEASCSYWSTRFGGPGSESQKTMLEGKYNEGQSNFKQKSVVYWGKTICCSITWWSSSWSSVWRTVRNLWSETELFLPIGGAVFRKNSREPYMLGMEVIDLAKLFKMVHLSSRSKIWRLSWAKFSKLFCGGIWKEIIWEITWEGIWISYLQQFFLSHVIFGELK